MSDPLSKKQLQFIDESIAKWNLAHGSVRSGKTVCTVFRFMQAASKCQGSKIYIVGHTFETAFRNVVKLVMEDPCLKIFSQFCSWSGKKFYFMDKTITVLGAKNEGALGNFQGDTYDLVYCDEMTLYPDCIIDMLDTRLSKPTSMGFAAMNPSYPSHKIKQWIDWGIEGDKNYYSLHFTLSDNPFVDEDYKNRVRNSLSGIFYKRNYLGLWCLAEGAIFDFFDRSLHVVNRPHRCADYYIAGIDYGVSNAFACLLIGVSTGIRDQTGKCLWVEKEYYWDSRKTHRQKTNSEFANDVEALLEPYGVKGIYIDPSALSMKLELQRRGLHVIQADNDVYNGIETMTSEMQKGNLFICKECINTIREIEGYVWDKRKSEQGEDEPVKKGDHACDALRYVLQTHKVITYDPYKEKQLHNDWMKNKYEISRRF